MIQDGISARSAVVKTRINARRIIGVVLFLCGTESKREVPSRWLQHLP
jgi:hypothetical protein